MTSPRDSQTASPRDSQTASLRDLQSAFTSAVRFGDAHAIARLVEANGIDPARRVGIYANNVRENFLATLEATFPVLTRLAGLDWLRQVGTAYLRVQPSRSGNLHYVGERFASHLEAELYEGPYAYFADVARLEWAYQEVLVAADRAGLDLAALADVPAEQHGDLVFELHPAARLVGSIFPLLRIWQANQPGAADDDVINLDAGASRLLVMRRESHVELRELPQGDFVLLVAIAASEPLASATEAAQLADPAFSLPEALVRIARLGVLAGFRVRSMVPQHQRAR
jgi:hypothetical protein